MRVYNIERSVRLRALLVAAHALAGLSVLSAELDGWIQFSLSIGLVLGGVLSYRTCRAWRLRCDVRQGLALWDEPSQSWVGVELRHGSVVLPIISVLCLRALEAGLVRYVIVMSDSLPFDEARRLRVCLKRRQSAP